MSGNIKLKKTMILTVLVSAIFMRLVPHIPNVAPVAAATLFGAAYLPKKYILVLPLIIAAVSDYLLLYINPFNAPIINFSHLQPLSAAVNSTTLYVWSSFMITALLGLLLRHKQSILRVGSLSIVSSLQFFLITNFGVWVAGAYARNFSGLAESYVAGLPFLQWTLLGDLFYSVSFFGIYWLAVRQIEGKLEHAKKLSGTIA